MAALSPWMWFVGLFAMTVLVFAFPNPIMILILLLGGLRDLQALEGTQGRR